MSTSETPNKLTVKERLLAAIEDAPEFALKEALRAIEIFKDIDFNNPEAFEDALDGFLVIDKSKRAVESELQKDGTLDTIER